MNPLDTITGRPSLRPPRVVIYGQDGVGKSTFAASAPAPIFVQTEDGLSTIDAPRFPLATSFRQVLGQLDALAEGDHEYQTVCIDSLDWLERLIWAEVAAGEGKSNIEEIGFARGYKYALTQWADVLGNLNALRDRRGMAVVLIAHARIERFEDPEHDAYSRHVVALHRTAAGLVREWADDVLFASYQVHTRTSEEGFGKDRTRGVGTGARVIRTEERPAHQAKNRHGLPFEMPLSWAAYAEALTKTKTEKTGDF